MTATEFMEAIKEMNNGERIILLNMLFDTYFDNRPSKDVIESEKIKNAWGETNE